MGASLVTAVSRLTPCIDASPSCGDPTAAQDQVAGVGRPHGTGQPGRPSQPRRPSSARLGTPSRYSTSRASHSSDSSTGSAPPTNTPPAVAPRKERPVGEQGSSAPTGCGNDAGAGRSGCRRRPSAPRPRLRPLAQPRAQARRQIEPSADELLDPHRHPEDVEEQRREALPVIVCEPSSPAWRSLPDPRRRRDGAGPATRGRRSRR